MDCIFYRLQLGNIPERDGQNYEGRGPRDHGAYAIASKVVIGSLSVPANH
jgi:hypothetical protein